MDSSKKIIVVVGATGNQGSSVAHTFLKLPGWHVRCVSRNPSSPVSVALTALGAEVVRADLSDASSLGPAFANANAIFLNTDFWETYRSPATAALAKEKGILESDIAFETEVSRGKNVAHAAAAVSAIFRLRSSPSKPHTSHPESSDISGKRTFTTDYQSLEFLLQMVLTS